MSVVDELTALHNLLKSGGITQSEFEELKKRVIKGNMQEVARIANSAQKSGPNPLQVGAMAAGATMATRLIMDHLKNDRELRAQIEKLQDSPLASLNLDNADAVQVTTFDTTSEGISEQTDYFFDL